MPLILNSKKNPNDTFVPLMVIFTTSLLIVLLFFGASKVRAESVIIDSNVTGNTYRNLGSGSGGSFGQSFLPDGQFLDSVKFRIRAGNTLNGTMTARVWLGSMLAGQGHIKSDQLCVSSTSFSHSDFVINTYQYYDFDFRECNLKLTDVTYVATLHWTGTGIPQVYRSSLDVHAGNFVLDTNLPSITEDLVFYAYGSAPCPTNANISEDNLYCGDSGGTTTVNVDFTDTNNHLIELNNKLENIYENTHGLADFAFAGAILLAVIFVYRIVAHIFNSAIGGIF